jgi:hypothetical protein
MNTMARAASAFAKNGWIFKRFIPFGVTRHLRLPLLAGSTMMGITSQATANGKPKSNKTITPADLK